MEEKISVVFDKEGQSLQTHLVKCFTWMFIGLLVTAVEAYLLIVTGALAEIIFQMSFVADGFGLTLLYIIPLILQIVLTVYLTKRLFKMSITKARVLFVVYAMLTGFSFSILPYIYDINTMFLAFGFSAVLFGSLAIIGATIKLDLTKYSSLILGGLITLIVVQLLVSFLNIQGADLFVCYAGLILFLIITAYDIQNIKKFYISAQGDDAVLDRLSIFGALQLYLDFVNIFLYVLRLFGRKD